MLMLRKWRRVSGVKVGHTLNRLNPCVEFCSSRRIYLEHADFHLGLVAR